MTRTQWLLALALVAAACTSPQEASTTSAAELSTTTTLALAEVIALGSHPADVEWCTDRPQLLYQYGRTLEVEGLPVSAGASDWKTWASARPKDFAEICATASLTWNADAVLERIADSLGPAAIEMMETELLDTERVWCYDRPDRVARSAYVLEIGPAVLLPPSLGLSGPLPWLRNTERSQAYFEIWRLIHPTAFVRSCKASFGSR